MSRLASLWPEEARQGQGRENNQHRSPARIPLHFIRATLLKRALLDLDDAEAYISQTDPSAAGEVVLKIIRAVSLLKDQPGLGRTGRVPGTRELVIPNTRYIVPYRVKDDSLQVLRVYHTSRIWPHRL